MGSAGPLAKRLIYSASELHGNGLDKLSRLAESSTVTRKFKNVLKSCGIYRPIFRDRAVLVHGKPQMRFDISMSNKRFKYLFYKGGKNSSDLPSKVPFTPITGYRDQTKSGRLLKAHPRKLGQIVGSRWTPRSEREYAPRFRTYKCPIWPSQGGPISGAGLRARINTENGQTLSMYPELHDVGLGAAELTDSELRVLGGRTFTIPPIEGNHKKYWYFFRRRGSWHISQHHPHGDEEQVYPVDYGR